MERKVMIVVEGTLYGKILAKEFQSQGYGVCAILDKGEDAIAAANRERPDTVLMDFLLQGDLNGIETAMKIRGTIPASIIFLDNRLEHNWLSRAGEIGSVKVISKHDSPAEIVEAVRDSNPAETSRKLWQENLSI